MLDELIAVNNDFLGWYPFLMVSFEGNRLTQRHKICSQETSDSTLSYGENPVSLSPALGSVMARNRQMVDRITIASMH